MSKLSLILKIVFSYLATGFLNLGILGVYLIFTKESLVPTDYPLFANIFLWPMTSFFSAQQILGEDQATVWNWFNLATVILFICLIAYFLAKNKVQSGPLEIRI